VRQRAHCEAQFRRKTGSKSCPGSTGAKSHIVRGLGNPRSLHSCSHGAGQCMSRSETERRFNRLELEAQFQGVECRRDDGMIDQISGSYKDVDQVMANQTDLVEAVHTLERVVCEGPKK